jgi:hypothetical protein
MPGHRTGDASVRELVTASTRAIRPAMRARAGTIAMLLGTAACAANAQVAAPKVAPCAPEVVTEEAAPSSLYAPVWQLESAGSLRELPAEAHPFTAERWECALGPEQLDDSHEVPRVVRARRLACTHASGATVQTALRCEFDPLGREPPPRTLPLTLDTAAPFTLRCTARAAARLELVSRDARRALCLTASGVSDCPSP